MKKYTLEEIKNMTTRSNDFLSREESLDFQKRIEQAEKDIEIMKNNATVNFRWSEFEIKRAKKIAKKLGMPYQTYIKSTLKQAMDKDETNFG
jgi:predicted DNA binding CopG/RHH family protein